MMTMETGGVFDTILGLPVHPLVVHFAVVLLPLSALGLIVVIIRPRWRIPFGYLILGGLLVGGGATLVAKESGEALAERVGLPQQHADLGTVLTYLAIALIVSALAWFVTVGARGSRWWLSIVLAVVASALAVAVSVLTVVVGHLGATAVWAGAIDDSETADRPTASTRAVRSISLADVALHAAPDDCWVAIDGSVYDLTALIARHPGGSGVITSLCGTDGTQAFNGQHSGEPKPARELATLRVGPLAP